jgi:nucleotide-binding universal stress UspA family protein
MFVSKCCGDAMPRRKIFQGRKYVFDRILLPLDGSEVSESALPYGEELAKRLGCELVLYHVHRREDEDRKRMQQVYLDSLAGRLQSEFKGSHAKVSTEVGAGEPTESICNVVEKSRVDLLVMTAVSASGLKVGKMLGSVADQVCRTVPIPVLLVRPGDNHLAGAPGQLFKRMLIPLDGSQLSQLALPVGAELAGKLKVSTTLFQMANMIRLMDDGSGSAPYMDYEGLNEAEKNRVAAEMETIEKGLREKGLDVTTVVTSGFDAASEIMDLSKKIGADLVVMSTHGRTGLGRWVFGNVAEKVVRYGQTPVLLVHSSAR